VGLAVVFKGEGGADALIEQIAGEYHVKLCRRDAELIAAQLKALLEHRAFGLLP